MLDLTMGVVESRFADIIWENEPISSTDLWKMTENILGWKKSTTFTVLKRLCEKGIFKNTKGIVTSVLSHDEVYSIRSEKFIEETFKGSLPAFLAAFTSRKNLSSEEIEHLKRIVAEHEE